jgi:hypothetical protein
MRSLMAGVVGVGVMAAGAVAQSAVQWRVEDGGNGHWYARSTEFLSFPAAAEAALARGGHLATPATQQENAFLTAQGFPYSANGEIYGHWIGGVRSQSTSAWTWITGESWFFSNFDESEPNGCCGSDVRFLVFRSHPGHEGRWDDTSTNGNWDATPMPALIEWSADCNNDGIVDYGQIRDGSLPDYNGNNIPDCCEQGTPCVVGIYPVQWRAEDGGNGHWYEISPNPVPPNWESIRQAASSRGAQLVTLTSAAEAAFVYSSVGPVWIGLHATAGSSAFAWSTGEPLVFTNWGTASCPSGPYPNNTIIQDRFVYMNHTSCTGEAGITPAWDDYPPSELGASIERVGLEWSADCNNDGLVDYGQILSGQLADANANGIPDICESTIVVPTQFPTIQAAIDSVPAGAARVISVLAGTYNQSFALNGKDIVVRGAPNNATILDGTGLATSVVRFTGGEPATAGIENLVIRNGTVGSLIFPKAPFRVGGGLYAANSSAFVKDCRFESNRADFGGGAYLFRSSTSVQGCVFLSNTAFSEGGALQLYESSGPIVGSSFTANAAGPAGAGAASALKVVGAQTAGATVLVSDCTIQDGVGGTDTSAVEMFENAGSGATPGVLRISNTVIEGNAASTGAGGLRVIGSQDSCVLADGTSICSNTPRNVLGPFLIEGKATVCDCLADLTLDGAVNGADLGVALAAWGAAASNGAGDANHDGIVDGADLASVLASWGACP